MLMAIIEFELHVEVDGEFRAILDRLLPRLVTIDGFLGAYPSSSLTHPGRLYEISYWRDAAALARWAQDPDHQHAMQRGRESILKWYRIRVGEVTRDWSMGEVPADLGPSGGLV